MPTARNRARVLFLFLPEDLRDGMSRLYTATIYGVYS